MLQKYLFPRTDYLTEDRAQSLLEDANPLLWHAVMLPWDDFQHSRRDDPRFRAFTEADAAWWLHGQIKQVVERLCDDRTDLGITPHTTKDNQFYVDVRGELTVVFKKLVRVYSPTQMRELLTRSNYPTRHNCDFWAQRMEAGLHSPRVIIGYEPIKAMSDVKIHVGYPRTKGQYFDWIYEMPNQVAAAKRLFELAEPESHPDIEKRGFSVESRTTRESKKGAV